MGDIGLVLFIVGALLLWPLSGALCDKVDQQAKADEDEYQRLLSKRNKTKEEQEKLWELSYRQFRKCTYTLISVNTKFNSNVWAKIIENECASVESLYISLEAMGLLEEIRKDPCFSDKHIIAENKDKCRLYENELNRSHDDWKQRKKS